jgi:hypothetical protein
MFIPSPLCKNLYCQASLTIEFIAYKQKSILGNITSIFAPVIAHQIPIDPIKFSEIGASITLVLLSLLICE